MDIQEKIFIACKFEEPFNTKNAPEAIIRNVTGTAKDGKMKSVLKNFVNAWNPKTRSYHNLPKNWEPQKYPNTPLKGHKIIGYETRSTSGRQWVHLEDPRGFVTEVSVNNIINLLKDVTVVNGVIQEECVWGFKQHARLISTNGKVYQNFTHEKDREIFNKITASRAVVGSFYEIGSGSNRKVALYLGKADFKLQRKGYWRATEKSDYQDYHVFAYGDEEKIKNDPNYMPKLKLTRSFPKTYETKEIRTYNFHWVKKNFDRFGFDLPQNIHYCSVKWFESRELGISKTY